MKAEDLVARCGARGLNLTGLAESETNARPVSSSIRKQRCGVVSVQLLENMGSRAYGKETRAMYESDWTVEQLAQAAAGLPEIAFQAACFAWAGQTSLYPALHDALFAHTLRLSRSFQWPIQVKGFDGQKRYYREILCALVLDVDQRPDLFTLQLDLPSHDQGERPSMFAIYCEVTEPVWRNSLADRFERIRLVYLQWLGEAARRIQSRLRDGGGE